MNEGPSLALGHIGSASPNCSQSSLKNPGVIAAWTIPWLTQILHRSLEQWRKKEEEEEEEEEERVILAVDG